MRLSEDMMLGRSITDLRGCNIDRCAMGAALNARGVAKSTSDHLASNRYTIAEILYPWICQALPKSLRTGLGLPVTSYEGLIYTYFDLFVWDYKTMTYEELCDLVRIMEPDCDCNQFGCTCNETAQNDSMISTDLLKADLTRR